MIKGRFFLTGSMRSGTTLLQSMLYAHHAICSLPETTYICSVVGGQRRQLFGICRRGVWGFILECLNKSRITLGIANPNTLSLFQQFLKICDKSDLAHLMKRHPLLIRRAVVRWRQTLDIIVLDRGYEYWLDKSVHPIFVGYIQRNIPGAKFIHLIRRGRNVIASFHDAALRYPGSFWERDFLSIDNCIKYWNVSIDTTRRWSHQKNHIVVFYEELCCEPGIVLKHICNFLDVEYDENMVMEYAKCSEDLVLQSEPWKDGVRNKIVVQSKFTRIFSMPEQEYIISRLENIEDLWSAHRILDINVE